MASLSLLAPIDPSSIQEAEQEKSAPWIVRKLVGVCPHPATIARLILMVKVAKMLAN
jgi:hypothetical protein